jgi:hypothetical protein
MIPSQVAEAFCKSDLIHLGSTPRHPSKQSPFITGQIAGRIHFPPVVLAPV